MKVSESVWEVEARRGSGPGDSMSGAFVPRWLRGPSLLELRKQSPQTNPDPVLQPRAASVSSSAKEESGLGCLLPSPDAGRGLGASWSPQGNICTFQTHVVSGGGDCQAPAQHPHPVLAALLETGLEGNGLRRGSRTCYVTGSSRASSCLLPLAGQDSAVGGRHPTPHPGPRAPGSSLFLQPS